MWSGVGIVLVAIIGWRVYGQKLDAPVIVGDDIHHRRHSHSQSIFQDIHASKNLQSKLHMSKKHWLFLAAILAVGGIGVALVLALALGFFAGHEEASATGSGLPVYTSEQSASSHAGYRHSTLTCGNEVYVNDYEEAALQIATSDPRPFIGRNGSVSDAKVCAIPGQPVTAYVAGDCGSEMPAYVPYRNIRQPPFDWRTATFREMTTSRPDQRQPYLTTTNAALLAEVVHNLRDGAPVELSGLPFAGVTNLTAIKMTSDQLPGLLFCPSVYFCGNGTIYLAESLMLDDSAKPPQVPARWIPAGPTLTRWLKSPNP